VQSGLLELALEKRVGEFALPPDCAVVCAGNRQEDRAGANRVITPLLNRFLHLDVGIDPSHWLQWATVTGLAPEVIAYIKLRPNVLYDFDPTRNERAYPTLRSWEFVARVCEQFRHGGVVYDSDNSPLLLAAISGCIGPGAASEFVTHLQNVALLPDPQEVLTKPETTSLPSEPSLLWSMVVTLASIVRRTPLLLAGYSKVLRRIPAEFAWFGLTQITAGLTKEEKTKIVTQTAYLEIIAACKKAGISMAGV
jgi:hypothetical protein